MSAKIRILKSKWQEAPPGTIAYISKCDVNTYFMTCASGAIIILQGYPWRSNSVRNCRRWFLVWLYCRRIPISNNWRCSKHYRKERHDIFRYRRCQNNSKNLSGICRIYKTTCADCWRKKTKYRKGLKGLWTEVYQTFQKNGYNRLD